MKTEEIARRLVSYCKKADWEGAHKELYAKEAKSIEPTSTHFDKETVGIDAITEKGKKFNSMIEKIHSVELSEPIVAGNTIAFKMAMDYTMKGGERLKSPELCVYQVKDDKIVSEEFFV